jgi:ribosome-associated protein
VEHIEESLKKRGVRPLGSEGLSFARWVLLDYGDVIVHVFEEETRAYYELEKFWLDAPRIQFEKESGKLAAGGKR